MKSWISSWVSYLRRGRFGNAAGVRYSGRDLDRFDRESDFWPTLNRVRFEAVPEINGDMIFVTMTTFTPGFKTFHVKTDDGVWTDSDDRFVWRLHSGRNRLEMRSVSKFGATGPPSYIELNWVAKHIPKGVPMGGMDQ